MKRIAFLVIAFLYPLVVFAGEGRWTGHGPFFTTFDFLEVSRSSPEVLYGGNDTMLVKSIDSGFTWKIVDFPGQFGPHVFKVHPKNSQIAFAVDYLNNGSYFSTRDGGKTWREIEGTVPGGIRDVEFHPQEPSILYAAQEGARRKTGSQPARVHRSTDAGNTWTEHLDTGSCCIDSFSGQIEIHDTNPNVIYAAFDQYFFATSDGGIKWRKIRIDNGYIINLKVDPKNPNVVYAATSLALWKSDNGGRKWTRTSGRCSPHIAIDPQRTSSLYTSGKTFRGENCTQMSSDGGLSWIDLNISRPSPIYAVNAIKVSPRSSNTLFASSDLLYRSNDFGKTWRAILNNKGIGAPVGLEFNAKITPDLFGANGNRLFRSLGAKGKWSALNTPVEFVITDLEIHRQDPNFIALAGGVSVITTQTDQRSFVLSEDGGKKWLYRSTPFKFTTAVVLDPNNSNDVFVSGYCPGDSSATCIGESNDRGETWIVRNTPGSVYRLEAWAQPSKKLTLFSFTRDGITTSTNGGKSWKITILVNDDTQAWFVTNIHIGQKYAYAVAINNLTNEYVRVFRTALEKLNWQEISKITNPLFPYPEIFSHPTENETAYAIGGGGILISTDAGVTWEEFNLTGLPEDKAIYDLVIDPNFPFTIYASSATGVLSFTNP